MKKRPEHARPVPPAPEPKPNPQPSPESVSPVETANMAETAAQVLEPLPNNPPSEGSVSTPEPTSSPAPSSPPEPPAPSGPLWLPGQAAQLSAAQQASYQIEGLANGLAYHASATLTWTPEPNERYALSYKVGAFLLGSRSQLSQGLRSATGLDPRTFVDQSRRTQTTTVDAERQWVQFSNQATPQPWQPGVQDRLSVFVQLGAWVTSAPTAFEAGQNFKLSVWSSRQTETWLIASQGRVRVATPYGEQMAWRLKRLPIGPGDAQIDIWYVPDWGPLPVRVEWLEANGNRVEQTLKGLEPPPVAQTRQAP